MSTSLLIGLLVVLVLVVAVWATARARQIRKESTRREEQALELMRVGKDPLDADAPGNGAGETVFDAGLPSEFRPGRGGIEVAEMSDVVDLEQLLAGEPMAAATRARALLEEPTNINLDSPTLPPRPVIPLPVLPPPSLPPLPAPAPAAKPVLTPVARQPSATERLGAKPAQAQPAAIAPTPRSAAASLVPAPVVRGTAGAPIGAPGHDVALRELVLAWFEARGYRSAPASPVVRPIELVLRHKDDPARAYAFVVSTQRVDSARVQQLAKQARSIGLIRVLIVADAGQSEDAHNAKKGVRVMDRAAMNAEFRRLDVSIAAKIIGVARKRAAAAA